MRQPAALCTFCSVGVLVTCFPALGDEGAFPALGGRPLIPARYTSGCGTDALYLCLDLNGVQVSYADFVRKSGLTSALDAIDLARLWQLARDCGAQAQALRVRNGAVALRKVMADLSIRTAVVHLRAVERAGRTSEEHFSAVLRIGDALRIVGEETYEREVAPEWESRWSGAVLLVSATPIVLSGPLSGAQTDLSAPLECRPARLDLDRKSEPGTIRRTIEVRPTPGATPKQVTAEIRGVPGAVRSVRHVADAGCWQVDLEFGPWLAEATMIVGAVVVSAAPNSEANSVELPVYVR
ncbi:MAG: hypothetical protein AB1601_06660 [Planctomycetota bacterium]